ncbi:HPF/RaiA family ribosome-associated protein [Aliiruegeria lutimaris]|uniref:Ribosome-associated translation inhibitor RaiA n=1 Tax=Aliiruegeria lutimaris TaxID=571298 RepID=A0A1G8QSP0_9RHOB|nr:HPF/RaiA family ribosome-associated protein [Aliiruegeria lutimaris]SDJ07661.1 Ribosome-associated translation inhibitor RaiA [Aliiruegeria lutimaris]
MQTAPIISYHNLDSSPAIEALVKRRVEMLENLEDRMTACEVTIEAPQKRKRHGRVFKVRLYVHLPGPDLTVSREVGQGCAQDDVTLAVNRAFSAAEVQLKRHKKTMARVEVKHHQPIRHGEVTLLERELGYGYLHADDGKEVYFQRDALSSEDWSRLEKGSQIRFRAFEGEKGPFAAAVTLVD